jgi:Rrf2 family iron-sulfur cluster assembly transcriptional regulator
MSVPGARSLPLSWCFVMICSRSAEYAIRGLVCLTPVAPGESMLVKQIAADSGIPVHFLAKILQDLVRHGLLKSNKGPRGGFRLTVPAADLPLLRIIETVDGPARYQRCIAGNEECHDRVACPMHDSWVPVRRHIVEYLQGTTIADLAKSLGEKRRLLARTRRNSSAK